MRVRNAGRRSSLVSRLRPDEQLDACGGLGRVLVLPHAHNRPAGRGQDFVIPTIAVHIPIELRGPVVGVRRGLDAVLRTAVPEASVDEDDHALGWESHIASAPDARRPPAFPESQAASM